MSTTATGEVAATTPATRPSRRRTTAAQRRQWGAAYVLTIPFFLIFVAMVIVPLVYAGYLSLFKKRLIGGVRFAGFDNYVRALTDPSFLTGVGRMTLFLLVQVPIMLVLALFVALALDSGLMKLTKFTRMAVYMPYAVPGVIAALMWGYLYGPDFGPFAQVAAWFGAPPPAFLSDKGMFFSIVNIVNWEFIGYNMIIMYAGLRSIPTELYEAARVDGASEARIALSIKIPAIRPAIMLTIIFSIIGSFQLFNEPRLMGFLAPTVIGTDWSPNLYAYNIAFVNQDTNYAAALSFLLGFVIALLSYIFQLSANRRERRANG